MKSFFLATILLAAVVDSVYGQSLRFTDEIYKPHIKTVQFKSGIKENSLPVYALDALGSLILDFDDLEAGVKNYNYTIVHCSYDWQPSNILTIEYIGGFTEDRIVDYQYSFNTLRPYTHYQLVFPNTTMKPLLTGNYLLKVYENNDPEDLVLTRRFYVVASKATLAAALLRSSINSERNTMQKINFKILHPGIPIYNPTMEVKAVIFQNARLDNVQVIIKPSFIRNNELVYESINQGVFNGGNEFREIDLRSSRFFTNFVRDIIKEGNRIDVYLFDDRLRGRRAYSRDYDMNGDFFIQNQEGRESDIDGDYLNVHFSLAAPDLSAKGDYYIRGKFSDWAIREENKLYYHPVTGLYGTELLLKQGIYDYEYVFLPHGTNIADTEETEGNFYETENNYTILVYYRSLAGRFDELIGFNGLNSGDFFLYK